MFLFELCSGSVMSNLDLSVQVSILDTGEVCMELVKCQNGQERVKEVLRISCDGTMVNINLFFFYFFLFFLLDQIFAVI